MKHTIEIIQVLGELMVIGADGITSLSEEWLIKVFLAKVEQCNRWPLGYSEHQLKTTGVLRCLLDDVYYKELKWEALA
jgi:hypothetical protein